NAGDERVNRVIEKFLVEPAHHKLRDGFFHAIAARLDERFAQHGELGLGGEEGRRDKSQRLAGHLNGPPVAHDVARLGPRVGGELARFEAGIAHELRDFGRLLKNRVRPKLGEKTVLADGLDDAANAPARFINRDRHALSFQVKRGRQSSDASADDCDGFHTSRNHEARLNPKQSATFNSCPAGKLAGELKKRASRRHGSWKSSLAGRSVCFMSAKDYPIHRRRQTRAASHSSKNSPKNFSVPCWNARVNV